jgi:LCP family protein required for cell wall assembly
MGKGGEFDIAKNIRLVEWLKCEILSSVAELYRLLASGIKKGSRGSQDAIADCLSSMIVAAYLLGKRLGIPFLVIDNKIESKIRLGMIEEHDVENIINILLIGQDRRPGESRARSDSMMILTINKKNGTIKITSLMRDMYVQIPGYSDNRINAAYAFGGMQLLNDTIRKNFLIHIDGNVEVDFDGFTQGIDTIGGVEITLTKKEGEHLKKRGFSNATEGKNQMDGKMALAYARIRKIGDDFGRTERQRNVIMAAIQKVKGSSIPQIAALANKVLPFVTTDMTNDQILNLAFTALKADLNNIEQHRIPVDGSYKNASIRGMSVLVPDLTVNRQELKRIIYGQ